MHVRTTYVYIHTYVGMYVRTTYSYIHTTHLFVWEAD